MKTMILSAILTVAAIVTAFGQTYVNGYFKSNGTYVQPHYRSSVNSTNHDNWSTRGNYNPYTGSSGSVARDYSVGASNYGSGHTISTGPRGGQYYINDNYNRVYVPKQPTYSAPVYTAPSSYSMPSTANTHRRSSMPNFNF